MKTLKFVVVWLVSIVLAFIFGMLTSKKIIVDELKVPRTVYRFKRNNISFDTRDDAKETLKELLSLLGMKKHVTIADYYDLCGEDGEYSDGLYGWKSLTFVTIFEEKKNNKWTLKFPDPVRLNLTTRVDNFGRDTRVTNYRHFYQENRIIEKFQKMTFPFGSNVDARIVLDNLKEILEDNGMATIGDFFSLVGLASEFGDQKYGWRNLTDAYYNREKYGWKLKLPRPIKLD